MTVVYLRIRRRLNQSNITVPEKCCQTVAVDLFGPMPSSKHVIVVHDLASRFPVAKLVSSTKADKVIPILGSIYNTYGNPEKHISDNGPPFNSHQMTQFATNREIQYTPKTSEFQSGRNVYEASWEGYENRFDETTF